MGILTLAGAYRELKSSNKKTKKRALRLIYEAKRKQHNK
ncbi:MAG: putative metal homeostasis protein [Liquorilactobacillus ghanensis]